MSSQSRDVSKVNKTMCQIFVEKKLKPIGYNPERISAFSIRFGEKQEESKESSYRNNEPNRLI